MIGENINKKLFQNASDKVIQYFSKQSVGIDISDRSIEVVEIVKDKGEMEVNFGRILLEPGIVENGRIVDKIRLKERILSVFKNSSPKSISLGEVFFALPESQVFSHVFSTFVRDQEELKKLIATEVESFIPIPFKETVYAYSILADFGFKEKSDKKEVEVVVVGVSNVVVLEWSEFFLSIGLKANFFEIEPCAYYSGLLQDAMEIPVCIVDIGSRVTSISVISKVGLFYTFSLPLGGEIFTQKIIEESIAINKEMSYEQVEEFKKNQDFSQDNAYAKIFKMIFQPIIEEIVFAIKSGEEKSRAEIKDVFLIGGTSLLNGLVPYLASQLKMALPSKNPPINVNSGQIRSVNGKNLPIEFAEALGSAWKGTMAKSMFKIIIPIVPEKKKQKVEEPVKNSVIKTESADGPKKAVPEDPSIKTKKQIKILLILFIVGIVAAGASFWFKAQRKKTTKKFVPVIVKPELSYRHDVEIEIVSSLETGIAAISQVPGIVLTDIVIEPLSYDEAIRQSSARIQKKVKIGNALWTEPLKVYSSKDKLVFPLKIDWFTYPTKIVEERVVAELDKKMSGKKYVYNTFSIKSLKYEEKNKKVIVLINALIVTDSVDL